VTVSISFGTVLALGAINSVSVVPVDQIGDDKLRESPGVGRPGILIVRIIGFSKIFSHGAGGRVGAVPEMPVQKGAARKRGDPAVSGSDTDERPGRASQPVVTSERNQNETPAGL
jgi:hypothetical protein